MILFMLDIISYFIQFGKEYINYVLLGRYMLLVFYENVDRK